VIHLNKTIIYAIVAVVIIVVVGAVAAYVLNNNGGTTNPTATPTPNPSSNGVASATNLTFSAAVTSQGTTTTYNWKGQNIHSNGPILRVDLATYAYILDAGQQKSWMSTDSGASWTAGNFTADWQSWSGQWTDYTTKLANWSGSGDYSYTNTAGEAIVISNIIVDPAIPASTFATS
jgi:archaellin